MSSTDSAALRPEKQRNFPKKSCKDVFHAWMLEGLELEGFYGIPKMKPVNYRPSRLLPFSEAVSGRFDKTASYCIHCYEHDNKFERLWRNPKKYLPHIAKHEAVIAPDFSLYSDFPRALQVYNTYRNYLIGAWLQREGCLVVPNARLDGDLSLGYTLSGIPELSTVAIGAHGCTKNRANRRGFIQEVKRLVDLKQPTNIIVYGSDAYGVFDYPREKGIPIDVFPCETSLAFKGVVHGKAR